MTKSAVKQSIQQLPPTGLKRASFILKFLPFSKTTLFEWSKDGRFPEPVRIGEKITCWRCEDIHQWLSAQGSSDKHTINDCGGKS
jgi:prophage regulatory protein